MKIDWKKLLINLAIPLAVGGLSTLVSGGMGSYQDLRQPPLSPPGWVFPIVWTILYLAMGYAAYRVKTADAPPERVQKALLFYYIQLGLNFLWPVLFFGLDAYWLAFIELLALWVAVCVTMWKFYRIYERSGDLLLPYLLWVTFAAYLNLGVFLLN